MLIAQITDIHIGFDRDDPEERNVRRLRAVLARLVSGPDRPDLVLLSGDLTEHGDTASYARLAGLLAPLPFPVRLMVGNHDERGALLAVFPDTPVQDGFIHYVMDYPGLRLVVLDTVEPGLHSGAFCAARAAWLAGVLDAGPDTPVVIAMHHPPVALGIGWMDPAPEEPWIARFAGAIAGRPQVRAIVTGHVHRTVSTCWHAVPALVCPSVAPVVALDLGTDDPAGRPMITEEPPAYALHRWDGERLTSHIQSVAVDSEWPVLARHGNLSPGLGGG